MKKAFGILFVAVAAFTGTTAMAQGNNGKGNGKNLQDTRGDQPVIVVPSDQVPAKDVPVVITRPDVQVASEDKAEDNNKQRTRAEQRQHAEERSGGRAFSGKGNDGSKSETKIKQKKADDGFTMVKYKEEKKGKKAKKQKDPYGKKKAYKAKKRK